MQVIRTVFLTIALATGAMAEVAPHPGAVRAVKRIWPLWQARQQTLDDMADRITAVLRREDVDDVPGLGSDDAALGHEMQLAMGRAQALRSVLAADLDWDGRVTLNEARIRARGFDGAQTPAARAEYVSLLFAADTDGDGAVSLEEYAARLARRKPPPPPDPAEMDATLLWADGDGDGIAAPEEIKAAVRQVLDAMDQNRNGTLTEPETEEFFAKVPRE
jgi:hypothetical protein